MKDLAKLRVEQADTRQDRTSAKLRPPAVPMHMDAKADPAEGEAIWAMSPHAAAMRVQRAR